MKDRRSSSPSKFDNAMRDIVRKNDTQHNENTERLIRIAQVMEAHIAADAVAFAEVNSAILEVNKDVKSLLASRSFLRGTWFAVVTVGTLIGVIAGLVVAWYRP